MGGYRPVPIRNWKFADEPSLAFAIQFGPYDEPFEYDSYAIFDSDKQKLVIPEDGPCASPPGFTWDWYFELAPERHLNRPGRFSTRHTSLAESPVRA